MVEYRVIKCLMKTKELSDEMDNVTKLTQCRGRNCSSGLYNLVSNLQNFGLDVNYVSIYGFYQNVRMESPEKAHIAGIAHYLIFQFSSC